RAATYLERTRDGVLYLDQRQRPLEVLRLSDSGATPEPLLITNFLYRQTSSTGSTSGAFPDGRIIVTTTVGGRRRLMVAKPGQDPLPFIQTAEDTSGPIAVVGKDRVAFLIGSGKYQKVALASIADGRLLGRMEKIDGAAVYELGSSPDAKTLYFGANAKVWAAPLDGAG